MKVAVRYFTRGGNTKKLADAVAEVAGVQAQDVSVPLSEDVDLLFLCSSVYAAGIDDAVKSFIENPGAKVAKIVNISTAALLPSTYKQVKGIADERGISVDTREFHCRGQFLAMHKGRPNDKDVADAKAFTRRVLQA